MAMRRIFVIGGTGTVGREVVRALACASEVSVRVGARREALFDERVEVVPFDLDDESTFAPAFEGVSAFFFVSPLVEHQTQQAIRVLRAARAAGVAHCVRLSSRATGWDDVCVLRQWHREIEAEIVASGLGYTMLRPCSFMQNVLGPSLEAARASGVFSIPLGTGRIPFIDAVDIGAVAGLCLREPGPHHGTTYVLTGGTALGGDELASVLSSRLERGVRYIATPHDVARRGASARGLPAWLVESGLRVYARAEDGEERAVDPAVERILGRAPGTFEAFAEREIAP